MTNLLLLPAHMSAGDEKLAQPIEFTVDKDQAGQRLDCFLADQLPRFSRTGLRKAINAKGVTVDGQRTKAAYLLRAGQRVSVVLPPPPSEGPEPENIPLEILHEDPWLVVVNKPAGMVVHPAKGHWKGTLTSALAYHFGKLSSVGGPTRPGIVHRLDRETSGVILVAKTNEAHLALARQFEERSVHKEYNAVVVGLPDRDRDVIRAPIAAHPYQREKMAIRSDHATSRRAQSFYEVMERYRRLALLKVIPETGRTHQIRVHLAHIGHPVLCDRLYGGRSQITEGEIAGDSADSVVLNRLALHAKCIQLKHPHTGEPCRFTAPGPDDLAHLLDLIRSHHK